MVAVTVELTSLGIRLDAVGFVRIDGISTKRISLVWPQGRLSRAIVHQCEKAGDMENLLGDWGKKTFFAKKKIQFIHSFYMM